MKMATATSETICKFNQSGFCKYQSHCRKHHIEEICQNLTCNVVTCLNRHPRVCRYFASFGRCKFGDSCAYLHQNIYTNSVDAKVRQDQANAVKNLEEEIVKLKKQIDDLRTVVDMKFQTLQGLSPPTNSSSNMTDSSSRRNHGYTYLTSG